MAAVAGNVKGVQLSQAFVKTAAGWLLGLMLAAAGAIVCINLVSSSVASPQQPVKEYLDALQHGEGEQALGLLRAKVPNANAAMLDGTALQTAASKMSDIKVGNPEPRGNNRMAVPVDYTLDGSRLHTEFLMERTGTQWLFFAKWAFVPTTLPTIEVTVVNASEATLNGVPVNMPNGRNNFAVFFPGKYEASLNGTYFEAPPASALVSTRDGGQAPLNLQTRSTKAMNEAVAGKVREFLDSCAAQATEQQRLQPDCPFYHASNARVVDGTIKWAISEYPKITIEPFGGKWVVAPLNGKATLTAREINLFTGFVNDLNVEHDFSFTTQLDVGPDTVTVTPMLTF
ncbi:hypothetical protein [Paenarthrobacter aurescens]|uniref:hypothetical protein n=1 Tax=Paenarthrobacter aurescens TaxID=43663 RepID=UPI0011412807|nr:hypothetical protein [Paenarthrobacter aurescens]MDO6145165.1 hypothetical protein [Paenarthrobacter aurescens]MDO6149010.1 hypothetical protein [Paenarthrobacter aurescens]MDO6160256.1 hypothetical protein [Paenarthrobacter aurescens]MDO6164115.1 hypothetical protein [Paenarthrobacter aurescens]